MIGNLSAQIPLIQGGMGVGVSLSNLAGAVAAQGGIGTISAAQIGFRDPEFQKNPIQANLNALSREIKKAKEIANGGIISVNIMTVTQKYEEYVKTAVAAGVDLIVSGAGLPMKLPELVQTEATKLGVIVSSRKTTDVICKYWMKKYQKLPDLIVIEGPLAGGHLGFSKEELSNIPGLLFDQVIQDIIQLVQTYEINYQKEIPVVVAGGVYYREDMEKYLAMGAAGVQLATRFVTTHECDATEAYKRTYLNAKKEDVVIISSPVGMPGRAINNPFIKRLADGPIPHKGCQLCISTCNPLETHYCITQALINAVEGNTDDGLLFCGENCYLANKIEFVKDIMDEFRP